MGLGLALGAFFKCWFNGDFAAEVKQLALARKRTLSDVTAMVPADLAGSPKEGGSPIHPEDKGTTEKAYQAGALHVLAELQKEGRLIDFLEENLSEYQDDEIGSSVRSIHEGCKKALHRMIEKEKIVDQEEESSVRVNRDYDSHAMKLTGRVSDQFPLKGVLVHPGWRVQQIKIVERPEKMRSILAPAEVEIG